MSSRMSVSSSMFKRITWKPWQKIEKNKRLLTISWRRNMPATARWDTRRYFSYYFLLSSSSPSSSSFQSLSNHLFLSSICMPFNLADIVPITPYSFLPLLPPLQTYRLDETNQIIDLLFHRNRCTTRVLPCHTRAMRFFQLLNLHHYFFTLVIQWLPHMFFLHRRIFSCINPNHHIETSTQFFKT